MLDILIFLLTVILALIFSTQTDARVGASLINVFN